jgi:ornithine--oxo-acid transaminase
MLKEGFMSVFKFLRPADSASTLSSQEHISTTEKYSAHNYHPLEVVICRGKGAWVWDVEGKKYLDMLSAYSALNFGHGNDRLLSVARSQLDKLTLTSRAFFNDQLGPMCQELAELCGLDVVLAMNSGAEAVETAIKGARKWGYDVKGVAQDQAEIICFTNNFHGRTTTIVSFSDSKSSRTGFGPFTPGFKLAEYGNIDQLKNAITKNTVGVLIEPIQGEAGILIPPDGYLRQVRELCIANNILMLADEIQTGLCRTGKLFACDHEGVKPDMYIIGKSLGGGIVPISAVIGRRDVMDVFTPGIHGSTFGGNPFACAIAREVIALIKDEEPEKRSQELGLFFVDELRKIKSPKFGEIRGRGLFVGVDIKPEHGSAKKYCLDLKDHGILCKDTRSQTIRFAPPLIIEKAQLEMALDTIAKVFA